MQWFRFNSRSRQSGESVAAYLAELRRLAEHCNYRDTLDLMLRDRLMWGINDAGIQKLLQESDLLTLARALTVAQAAETADKNLLEMKAPPQEMEQTEQGKSEPIHQEKDRRGRLESGMSPLRAPRAPTYYLQI